MAPIAHACTAMSTREARREGKAIHGSEWDAVSGSAAKVSTEPKVYAIEIEDVEPQVDGGRYDVKRAVGDVVDVSATIFKDGHDVIAAAVLYRATSDREWTETAMLPTGHGHRWEGRFQVDSNERYLFTIETWVDRFATWRRDMRKRIDAAQDVAVDLLEGTQIAAQAAGRADPTDAARIEKLLARLERIDDVQTRARVLLNDDVAALVSRWQPRVLATRAEREYPVWVDRRRALFASWYEFFPRSEGALPGTSGTLRASEARLEAIAAMGFDVVYLPPIHPVGTTARKGPNNTLVPGAGDPGSPWAIGNETGGHTAIEPALGTLDDFDHFVTHARSLGLEIALDFALQCSPDHPWVREHPEWFVHRPDGSIRYAENPPKKYQDIYPLDFWGAHRDALWNEVVSVLQFWIGHGVKTFRVDNPHTKPIALWEYAIARIRADHPDVIFLAEAFTAAPMMRALAKIGFSQSYTYFTWKNSAHELTEYIDELLRSPMREYFRGNLWPNTPDILHAYLQHGGRPAFVIRAVLASTLSSLWGIYSGYELVENVPVRDGSEEYLDSEKYQYKPRDWSRADSLAPLITRLNRVRRENPALQQYHRLDFVAVDDPNVIAYVKSTEDRANAVLTVVAVDPHHPHASHLWIDPPLVGVREHEPFTVRDALTDETFAWKGGTNWVQLTPDRPAHVFVIERTRGNIRH